MIKPVLDPAVTGSASTANTGSVCNPNNIGVAAGVNAALGNEANKVGDLLNARLEVNQEAEENNFIEMGMNYADEGWRVTCETMTANDFGDWIKKQGFIGNNVIANGFSFDKMDDLNDSWEEIQKNKMMGPKVIESSLSEEEQKAMREYAVALVEQRLNENKENMPDYGDCKDYYNEGSLTDWIIPGGHVTAFAIKGISPETYEQMQIGENGMLSLFNIASNAGAVIEDTRDGNKEDPIVRDDHSTDILGDFRSVENIQKDIDKKEAILAQLKENINNPEEFAKLYYQVTDGMNFSADKVKDYKEAVEKGEDAMPINNVIGRNYISEDIAKNEMGTNIQFEVNKTVGTVLLKKIPPLAFAVNVGVSILDEHTKENPDTSWDRTKEILTDEALRTFSVSMSGKIRNFLGDKLGGSGSYWSTKIGLKGASSATQTVTDNSGSGWGWDLAEAVMNPASILETGIRHIIGAFA